MPFCVAIFLALYSALSAFFISAIGTAGRASAMARMLVLSGHLRASSLRLMMSFIVLYTFFSIVPAVESNHHKPLPDYRRLSGCHPRASDCEGLNREANFVGGRGFEPRARIIITHVIWPPLCRSFPAVSFCGAPAQQSPSLNINHEKVVS